MREKANSGDSESLSTDQKQDIQDVVFSMTDFGTRLQEALSPLSELQRTIDEMMRSFTLLKQECLALFRPLADFRERIPTAISELAAGIVKVEREANKIRSAGWLPHSTFPFHFLNDELDAAALNKAITDHYKTEWLSTRQYMQSRISSYNIDEEAKAAFTEALDAHEYGLYRCVSRTLFPEIERLVRVELHAGAIDRITSQKKLRELVGHLPLGGNRT